MIRRRRRRRRGRKEEKVEVEVLTGSLKIVKCAHVTCAKLPAEI